MTSLQHSALNFNKSLSYNFDGGNLSSDSGLLLVRSFIEKLGLRHLLENTFNDSEARVHTNASIIEQLMYTTIAGYSSDVHSDSLRLDPVFTRILEKKALASQPTISRFVHSLNEHSIESYNRLLLDLFEKGNHPKKTKQIVLDLDSTLFPTFGKQEGSEFNYHYSSKGYHPLMLFNGINGDLMKVELRKGSVYTSNNIKEFLEPIIEWLEVKYPKTHLLVRADSGFATPDLYNLCLEHGVPFVIKLKSNKKLKRFSEELENRFWKTLGNDYTKHHVMYDDFYYQASSWSKPLRVICRLERAAGELVPRKTFIVTTLETFPANVVKAYNKRGNMENFIKEAKIDFSMESASHSSFMANVVKTMIKSLAYSVINIMKRLVFRGEHKKSRMLSLRSLFIKVACRVVTSARRTTFKLCSSYPLQEHFQRAMTRIEGLSF
ncbi:Transposase DDE domain group 1 [Dethiosulfatibacter aminovorans DSM 17477]|uniref:Transposase DDE domain group 1 n=3 Tax=Dethiosulfatibacter aminovorans DSM 17477 TaxID=1121476 RepID=A0A1M6NDD7_9FIRM|nr:IS1380 family transposase [Dethiosulfatibacter aminovorans]SHJ93616.1 Transposase DDE domain group 1 [Dethiosulfatibacter aminovorans DSM 17477]